MQEMTGGCSQRRPLYHLVCDERTGDKALFLNLFKNTKADPNTKHSAHVHKLNMAGYFSKFQLDSLVVDLFPKQLDVCRE